MNIKRFFSTGNDKRSEQALQMLRDEKDNNITNNGKEMIIEFDYQSHNITLEMGFFSGKEAVYVDDKQVSEQRNLFKFKGIHQVTIDDTPHELHMGFDSVADWLKSEACFYPPSR